MEKKIQGIIFFSILIIYYILWDTFSENISPNFYYVFWGIWIILLISFFYWLSKKTDFFKKQGSVMSNAEHRMDILTEMGYYSVIIPLLYLLGVISLGLGFFMLFSNQPNGSDAFIGLGIMGLVVISIAFFIGKWRKKNKK